jgi:hypothetical protein
MATGTSFHRIGAANVAPSRSCAVDPNVRSYSWDKCAHLSFAVTTRAHIAGNLVSLESIPLVVLRLNESFPLPKSFRNRINPASESEVGAFTFLRHSCVDVSLNPDQFDEIVSQ